MSNTPIYSTRNLVLSPDWAALAKIGKAFHLIYIAIVVYLVLMICGVPFLMIFCNGEKNFLSSATPLVISLGLVLGTWCIFSIIAWIILLVRIYSTPESIVDGGGIGRTFVILSIISFLLGIVAGIMKLADPSVSLYCNVTSGLLNFVAQILFLMYMWRLAFAVHSDKVKSCIRWIVFGSIALFVLGFTVGILGALQSGELIGAILAVCFLVLFVIVILSGLNMFGYMAKDIQIFIANHSQMYITRLNQNE